MKKKENLDNFNLLKNIFKIEIQYGGIVSISSLFTFEERFKLQFRELFSSKRAMLYKTVGISSLVGSKKKKKKGFGIFRGKLKRGKWFLLTDLVS